MQNQDHYRRKTRSQLVDQDKQASRPQIPSQSNLDPCPQNSDIDSSKIKEQKQQPARKSNWNRKQRIKYFVFLNYYSDLPYWGSDLKSIPTYKALSQFVKSRSPEQCKSFHLSTRRNYRSIEEEMKALQEELEGEEGYQKMLDRYEIEIIGFEEEHNMLKLFDLEEKKYFHNKLAQKCKQTGFNNKQPNNQAESPQDPEHDYNPKFNIKELISKEAEEKRKESKSQVMDSYQPLINMQFDRMNQGNPSEGQKVSNSQYPAMAYFGKGGPFTPTENNKTLERSQMERMRPQGMNPPIPYGARNHPNTPNERLIQENMARIMQANKNVFPPYSNYNPYVSSPFSGMGQMHMSQFRNQLPYSIPPPGGIPYMMEGYPYNLSTIPPPYGEPNSKAKPNGPEQQSLTPQKPRSQQTIPEPKQQKIYSEQRKELLLECHQHWVNWLRAAIEINRRKQMGIVINGNSQ